MASSRGSDAEPGLPKYVAEFVGTFMLILSVGCNVLVGDATWGKDQFHGLSIGFSVVAGGYGAGSISGGCFNPAVALGIDASSMGLGFGWCLAYFIFEILGACVASALFRVCRPEDFHAMPAEEPPLSVCLLSEFLGTYMLILTVGLNLLAHSKAAVFSIAASLMCMVFALGSVSGAHFNPAVTMAVLCSDRGMMATPKAAVYMVMQLAGGVTAAFTFSAMQNGRTVPLKPTGGACGALLGELVFTCLLSFVVLCVATIKSPLSQYFGLAIGSCVTAGGLAIGSLSGGSLNPAVSTGLALSDVTNGGSLAYLPSYAAVELLGGVLAAGIFRATYTGEYADKV